MKSKNGYTVSSNGGGGEVINSKPPKAPNMLCSSRMTVALICLWGTWSLFFQRLIINFSLVCMVKPPNVTDHLGLNHTSSIIQHTNHETIFGNITAGEDETGNCPKPEPKNYTGTGHVPSTIEGEFDWSKDIQGLILAAYFYGYVVSQIPGGLISERIGPKKTIIGSVIFTSLFSIAGPPAAYLGYEYLMVTRFLGGVANGAAWPAISTMQTRWFPDIERAVLSSIAFSGPALAASMSYPISAFFCENFGWPSLFYFGGALGLIWSIATCFLIFEWPELHPRISEDELTYIQKRTAVKYTKAKAGEKKKKQAIPWVKILLSPAIWAVFATNFGCFWLVIVISTYLPTYFKEVLHLDVSENGSLSAIPFGVALIVHFIAGIVADRLLRLNLMSTTKLRKTLNSFGAFSAAIATMLIGTVPCDKLWLTVALVTCSQLFLEFSFMGGFAMSLFEVAPKFAAPVTSIMMTFGLTTGLLCPPLVSYLTPTGSRAEWISVFNVSGAICIVGGLIYLIFGSAELQPWAKDKSYSLANTEEDPKDKEMKIVPQNAKLLGDKDNTIPKV